MKKFLLAVLRWGARRYIRKVQPYVIGITGSMGKTSCRMVISQVLQQSFPGLVVRTSSQNFNTEYGLALSILGIESFTPTVWGALKVVIQTIYRSLFSLHMTDVLVLEYGLIGPKDMDYLVNITNPHISILTGIDKVHAVHFETLDELIAEKLKLAQATKEIAFFPADAPYAQKCIETLDIDTLDYAQAQHEQADIGFSGYSLVKDPQGVPRAHFSLLQERDMVAQISTNLRGREYASYVALGCEIVMILEKRLDALVGEQSALRTGKIDFVLQPGRSSVFMGKCGSVVVDSSYNASPRSMRMMISNTIQLRKEVFPEFDLIYCLGNMNELGDFAEVEHRALASSIAQSADEVFLVGKWMHKVTADELVKLGYKEQKIHQCKSSRELGQELQQHISTREHRSLILFKGSQGGIYLEEAVKGVLKNKEDEKLLPRQSRWWLKRKA